MTITKKYCKRSLPKSPFIFVKFSSNEKNAFSMQSIPIEKLVFKHFSNYPKRSKSNM